MTNTDANAAGGSSPSVLVNREIDFAGNKNRRRCSYLQACMKLSSKTPPRSLFGETRVIRPYGSNFARGGQLWRF